jgi:hypothetical protein
MFDLEAVEFGSLDEIIIQPSLKGLFNLFLAF